MRFAFIASCLLFLAACGQKDDLYLPEEQQAKDSNSSLITIPSKETK